MKANDLYEILLVMIIGWFLAFLFFKIYPLTPQKPKCEHKHPLIYNAGGGYSIVQCMDCDEYLE